MKYTENQKFKRTDIVLLLVTLIGAMLYQIINQFVVQSGTGRELPVVFFIILGLLVVLIGLHSLTLITKIDKKGIRFQFYPWHFKTQKIAWEDIVECRVIDAPIQANAWISTLNTPDLFYSFTGRKGLEVRLTNGQHIFIGSSNPQEVANAVQRFMPVGL